MNESAGKLNQAFIEQSGVGATLRQPQVFKNIMGFVKELTIKTVEIADIMGIEIRAGILLNGFGNTFTFATHAAI